jgi:ankyrin repeat protein
VSEPIDPGVIALAAKVFDLAREGDTEQLAAYLEAGVPANLTNDKGDTLLILAAYRGHTETVAALLERGSPPARPPTAVSPAPGRPPSSSNCRR